MSSPIQSIIDGIRIDHAQGKQISRAQVGFMLMTIDEDDAYVKHLLERIKDLEREVAELATENEELNHLLVEAESNDD